MEYEKITIEKLTFLFLNTLLIESKFKGIEKPCAYLYIAAICYKYPAALVGALYIMALFHFTSCTQTSNYRSVKCYSNLTFITQIFKPRSQRNYPVFGYNCSSRLVYKSSGFIIRNLLKIILMKVIEKLVTVLALIRSKFYSYIEKARHLFNKRLIRQAEEQIEETIEELSEEPISVVEEQPHWPPIGNYGVPHLPVYDMTASIDECCNDLNENKLQPPKRVTKFLFELGYFEVQSRESKPTFYNSFIFELTKDLRKTFPAIEEWKATPTTAQSIFTMVQSKIDRAPVEQHHHWKRLRKAYSVLNKWMEYKKCELQRLSNDEVIKSLKLSSSMGMQEKTVIDENKSFTFESIKDYIEFKLKNGEYLWQKRVKIFRNSLIEGKPILGVFNTVAKAERKNKNLEKANRLIWYLPATARIFEAQIFGGLEDCLKKLPYSVSGIPLYDYGELLADIMQQNNRKAICNDISGWDTRVSYGLLCLEANFLRNLTKDESMKEDITNLYRLYANAHVMIARDGGIRDEIAVYKLRGQVASGRRTTYAMNTITNTVVSLCAAAYSYGIKDKDFDKWMLNCLNKRHTDDFGGKISGDDSVLIFGPKQAELYSKKAHKFLNEIGLIRKDLELNKNSHIIHNMEDITFCSNQFVKVKYSRNRIERWMPVKPVEDILGKACIMLEKPKDKGTEEAWARIQGIELLFNYHHIPEVRALALALLSCTSSEFSLESLSTGWKRLPIKCYKQKDPLKIINKCLFGKSSKIKKLQEDFPPERINTFVKIVEKLLSLFKNCDGSYNEGKGKVVKRWSDLGELDSQSKYRLGLRICGLLSVQTRDKVRSLMDEWRQDWFRSIPLAIRKLRRHHEHNYTDWNNNMNEIKNLNEIQKIWKNIQEKIIFLVEHSVPIPKEELRLVKIHINHEGLFFYDEMPRKIDFERRFCYEEEKYMEIQYVTNSFP